MWPGIDTAKEFLLGAVFMGDLVAALCFLRYRKVTGNRFFLFFAWSFAVGALSRAFLAGHVAASETEPLGYLMRLLSYVIILLGIVDINRSSLKKVLFQRT
jgi:hypothetical protein